MSGEPAQPSVHVLMARVVNDLPSVGKGRRNEQQGFAFRGIDDVVAALNPVLGRLGLFIVPEVLAREHATEERHSERNGRATVTYWNRVWLHVRFTVYGPAGDSVSGTAWGEGLDNADKATSKAHTMALKSWLLQAFMVATQDQEDPDASTPPPAERQQARQQARQQQRRPQPPQQPASAPQQPAQPPEGATVAQRLGAALQALSPEQVKRFIAFRKEQGIPPSLDAVSEEQAQACLRWIGEAAGG